VRADIAMMSPEVTPAQAAKALSVAERLLRSTRL
jgi:hypothetical protein